MTCCKKKKILILCLILVPILFISYIVYGFVFHESAQTLKSTSFKEYKVNMKNKYTNITRIDTYYQFGRITFDFKSKDISEEECYKILEDTKKFVMALSTDEFGYSQTTIRVTFTSEADFYEFENHYNAPNLNGDSEQASTENHYETWYKY